MKKIFFGFMRRGATACGIGPIVLAILYLIMQGRNLTGVLTVDQVCIGVFSITALAFIAGGMNVIYQIERLPLMLAILIHGVVLYIAYLATYLVNGWLENGVTPILVFSAIFVVGYLVIWCVVYLIIRKSTARVNRMLREKQRSGEERVNIDG